MTVLFVWCFFVSNVNAPIFVPLAPAAAPTPQYSIPPSMAFGEFSSLTACTAAGEAIMAKLKADAAPNFVKANYLCVRKA